MRKLVCSSLSLIMLSATIGSSSANQCQVEIDGEYLNPTEADVSNIRTMVNDAEEGLAELESLVVTGTDDVVAARNATMKVSALVTLAGTPDSVGSMAARGYLSRRGVKWGPAVHQDVNDSIYLQPHTISEPGETTPFYSDAIYSAPEGSVGALSFKWAGRAFLVVGIGASAIHVYSADDHLEAAAEEGASWGASLAAGETAGLTCALTGVEVAVPLCVIVGAALGGGLGKKLGDALFHGWKPDCYDPSKAGVGCIESTRPNI